MTGNSCRFTFFEHSQASAESDRALISVQVENDFNPHTGINKEDSYVLQSIILSGSAAWQMRSR